MANHVELRFSALTDSGKVRSQNEDAIAILPQHGVAILADGMGGYSAGEIASRIAVDVCVAALEQGLQVFNWWRVADRDERLAQLIRDTVVKANIAINDAAQQEPQYAGMGTTLVVALLHHDRLLLAHLGDSRAYRLRDGCLEQLTRDHSQVQEQVDAGLLSAEQARHAPNRNLVTRALGIAREIDTELHIFNVKSGDIYLLCSDGLSDMVIDAEIKDILYGVGTSLDRASSGLVERANQLGGLDNISVVIIRVEALNPIYRGVIGRMLNWMRLY